MNSSNIAATISSILWNFSELRDLLDSNQTNTLWYYSKCGLYTACCSSIKSKLFLICKDISSKRFLNKIFAWCLCLISAEPILDHGVFEIIIGIIRKPCLFQEIQSIRTALQIVARKTSGLYNLPQSGF